MSTDWNTEAGGLCGLGRKPEGTVMLPKATPLTGVLGSGRAPLQTLASHDQAKASGCMSGASGAVARGRGWAPQTRRATVEGVFLRVLADRSPPATLILLYGVVSGLF